MNKREIREYLEQIYNVRVAKVNTQNILGEHSESTSKCVTGCCWLLQIVDASC